MKKKKWLNSKIIFTITMVFVVCCFMSTSLWADYCESSGNTLYFHTTGVVVGDLENSSGDDGGYGDYTHLTAHLTQGKTFSVSLEHYGGMGLPVYWKIWIDYNGDEDFDDPCEEVFSVHKILTVNGSITVPWTTITGETRMRVSMGAILLTPCGNISYGEVEDYTVDIACNKVGNTDVFSLTSTSPYRRAMPFTMPEDGIIKSVSIYHEGSATGNDRMDLAVYADDGEGSPQKRLAFTPPDTYVSTSPGWQTVELRACTFVSGGSTVWLAWVFESNPGIRYQTGSPGRFQSSDTWSGHMPYYFGSGTQVNYIYSIYANYNRCGCD